MNPILIAGAALVGLPILLHLIMKREPKRMPFPAIRFLHQKKKSNQRKMRIRHIFLLLMRSLLIALFALALYQPRVLSEGLNLSSEQPIAAVLVIDTSPSMGYRSAERTRLDEARRRALELLDDLPPESRVAVIDPIDPVPLWQPSIGDARRLIETIREPHGGGVPMTTGLSAAYRMLRDQDNDFDLLEGQKLPSLVALFSDRTAASWDGSRNDDLVRLRDNLPVEPAHLLADVGVDQPTNVAITGIQTKSQVVPQGQPITLTVTLQATGAAAPSVVVNCRVDNSENPERREIALPADSPRSISFTFEELPVGFHQAEVQLENADRLPFDNSRYFTFRVAEARKILAITDDPDDAIYWRLAHDAKGEFQCDVKTPAQVGSLGDYEMVTMLSVADPDTRTADGDTLWGKLLNYVRNGGNLLIIPGDRLGPAYESSNPQAAELMPGKLVAVRESADGMSWQIDDAALRQPLMAPFRDWRQRGNVDFLNNPRRAFKFWEAEAEPNNVVVRYGAEDDAERFPAVLQKSVGNGQVLLLTVRMDSPWDASRRWHNYWETAESSWGVVFPNLLARFLAGDVTAANYNYATAGNVVLPLPPMEEGGTPKFVLEGPGITPSTAHPEVGVNQTELRLDIERTLTPGNYVLRTEAGDWQEAYSLNARAEESNLERVAVGVLEEVLGEGAVIPADKELAFRDSLQSKFDQPFELFPWLLIAVLILLAVESLVANRFYGSGRGG